MFLNLLGTLKSAFQLGLGGPLIKNAAGVVQIRNGADTIFLTLRVATPVNTNDATTKAYVDANLGVTSFKKIASGSTVIASGTPTTVSTVVGLTAGHILMAFVTMRSAPPTAGETFTGDTGVSIGINNCAWSIQNSTTAGTYLLRIRQQIGSNATVDWVLFEITP